MAQTYQRLAGMMVVAPDIVYDSWVTIGATSSEDVDNGVVNVIPGSWSDDFAAGNGFLLTMELVQVGTYFSSGLNGVSGDDQKFSFVS